MSMDHPGVLTLLLGLLLSAMFRGQLKSFLLHSLEFLQRPQPGSGSSDGQDEKPDADVDTEPLFHLRFGESPSKRRDDEELETRVDEEPEDQPVASGQQDSFFNELSRYVVALLFFVPVFGIGSFLLVVFFGSESAYRSAGLVLIALLLPSSLFAGYILVEIIRRRRGSLGRVDTGWKVAFFVSSAVVLLVLLLLAAAALDLLPIAGQPLSPSSVPPSNS